jgi:hypothetical protein
LIKGADLRRAIGWIGFALLAAVVLPRFSGAAVESEVLKSLSLEAAPLDVAVSADGRWTFVLLPKGEIQVYSASGELQGGLRVGEGAERIAPSPQGDRLFVTSRSPQELSIVGVDFVYPIDVTGSPFKGPAGAPVVVAVYSDFQ